MEVSLQWLGEMQFKGYPPSGAELVFDAHPEHGGEGKGPQPLETLLMALAACTAMDVISILHKKRQQVSDYRVVVHGTRPAEGVWPRPFTEIKIVHIVSGENLDPEAVARAVQLSDEKYCSVTATLRACPKIEMTWQVN